MLTIMLVDDEVLALDYLKNMVAWEEHGYRIAGCASSAKKALELYDRTQPDIVISDIRMPVTDGLELTKRLKEKNKDVVIILLSAYGDFEYAQKAIRYGVSNYLLKHELCEELLLAELGTAAKQLEKQKKKTRIYQEYFVKQLIYQTDADNLEQEKLGNRLFLMLVHKRSPVVCGEFAEAKWSAAEQNVLIEAFSEDLDGKLFYAADAQITDNNWMVLYRIANTASTYTLNGLIERKCAQIEEVLKKTPDCSFDILYSYEITRREISEMFRKMSRQIRGAFFLKANQSHPVTEAPSEEHRVFWGEKLHQLKCAVYGEDGDLEEIIEGMFQNRKPEERLDICKSLLPLLNNLLREISTAECVTGWEEGKKLYEVNEVMEYYKESFLQMHEKIMQQKTEGYSKLVQEMIHYIRANYEQDLSLDMLGEVFQMNGVYLGQIFKKEVGVTFLKYVTSVRIEEAKRLLSEGNSTVSKTAKQVGYYTSQYFAKVFFKTVGMTPQEYKKCREEE